MGWHQLLIKYNTEGIEMKKKSLCYPTVLMILFVAISALAEQSSQTTLIKITTKKQIDFFKEADPGTANINVAAYISRGGIHTNEGLNVTVTVRRDSPDSSPVEAPPGTSPTYTISMPKGSDYYVTVTPPAEKVNIPGGASIPRWGEPQTLYVGNLRNNTILALFFEEAV